VVEARVVGHCRYRGDADRREHSPGVGDHTAGNSERGRHEPGEEERQDKKAAEDPARDYRICERGDERQQRPEGPPSRDGLEERPDPVIVQGVEVAQRELEVARLVPLGHVTAAKAVEPEHVEGDRHTDDPDDEQSRTTHAHDFTYRGARRGV
jgi:hypothetical protein